MRQGQQRLQRSLIAPVIASLAAFFVHLEVSLSTGAMVVEIGIKVLGIEVMDGLGVLAGDVAVAHVLAHDGAILGFPPARCRCCAAGGSWSARSAACSADGPRSG